MSAEWWMHGGITPATQRVIVPEAEKLRAQATRLEKAIGTSSADFDRPMFAKGDGFTVKAKHQAFTEGPTAQQIRAMAWQLRKRAIMLELCALARERQAAGVVATIPQGIS